MKSCLCFAYLKQFTWHNFHPVPLSKLTKAHSNICLLLSRESIRREISSLTIRRASHPRSWAWGWIQKLSMPNETSIDWWNKTERNQRTTRDYWWVRSLNFYNDWIMFSMALNSSWDFGSAWKIFERNKTNNKKRFMAVKSKKAKFIPSITWNVLSASSIFHARTKNGIILFWEILSISWNMYIQI